jgi:hypothetical protein
MVLSKRKVLNTSVILCRLKDSAESYDMRGKRNMETIFVRAGLKEMSKDWKTDPLDLPKMLFRRSLVYGLSSPEDIYALVSMVLKVRDDEQGRSRIE